MAFQVIEVHFENAREAKRLSDALLALHIFAGWREFLWSAISVIGSVLELSRVDGFDVY